VDDNREYYLFKDCDQLYRAPKPLERFYLQLRCRRLGDLIDLEEYTPPGLESDTAQQGQRAEGFHNLVLQRSQLYLETFDDRDLEDKHRRMSTLNVLL
jgi:hypothetical protein